MKALILAAGQGTRLAHPTLPKPLVPLLGLPLLERVIRTAHRVGVTEFGVCVGWRGEEVAAFLRDLSSRQGIPITPLPSEHWEAGNGASALAGAPWLSQEPFLLLMADHLVEEVLLRKVLTSPIRPGEVCLAVDRVAGSRGWVDLSDVTRVRLEGDRVVAIGKHLEAYHGYDTGVFLCTSILFEALEATWKEGDGSLTLGIARLARQGRVRALDVTGYFWIDVDDPRAFRLAEQQLLASLVKVSDGPISRYLNRPLSLRISRRLVQTPLRPNQISLLSFALCLVGAGLFALGAWPALALGGLVVHGASVLDGCDGEVARLRMEESDFGGWLDAVLDRYADAFLILGLTLGAAWSWGPWVAWLVGFLALLGSFMNSYTADKYDGVMRRLLKGRAYFRLGRDVRMFLLTLGGVAGFPLVTLVVLTLLMHGETLRRIWVIGKVQGTP